MFTQRISMDCTKEQYEKCLKEELLKMGYNDVITFINKDWRYVISNSICNSLVGDLWFENRIKYGEHYLGSFNAPLFLALAAMTDNPDVLGYGEYATREIDKTLVRNEYSGREIYYTIYYKSTKEEIMAKFGKTETDTNYDAAKEFVKDFCYKTNNLKVAAICDNIHQSAKKAEEQENAIKLLRENGYKILKPKTWEEV